MATNLSRKLERRRDGSDDEEPLEIFVQLNSSIIGIEIRFKRSYVSETERRYAFSPLAQRHFLAGLASAVKGLIAPYEKASNIHERAVINWLWSTGCHPFGTFYNSSQISQMLQDVILRSTIYARVDFALHKIHESSEVVQSFALEYLKTPLGEPVNGKKEKSSTELWVEKFYKKFTKSTITFPT